MSDPVPRATAALVALVRAFGLAERDRICCGEVTVAQCVTLQALRDGALEQGALARATGTSRPAATRMVDGLERRGWVERQRQSGDRRRVSVALTPEGEEQARALMGRTEGLVGTLLSRIPQARHEEVLGVLELLAQAGGDLQGGAGGCC